jgi:hypothetical protein
MIADIGRKPDMGPDAITSMRIGLDNLNAKFDTFNKKFDLFVDKHNQCLEKILEKLTERGNHVAINSKNVKIPVELEELVKARSPDAPPGETLFAIYKEFEYLETVARRVTGAGENDKINISEAIDKFFANTNNELAQLKKSHGECQSPPVETGGLFRE